MFNKLVFLMSLLSCSGMVLSEQNVHLESVNISGEGCPYDTTSVTPEIPSESDLTVSISLNQYNAVSTENSPVASSDCNITISLSTIPGFTIDVESIDWHGTAVTASDAFINFHREFFISGHRGETKDYNWVSPGFENFLINGYPKFDNMECDGGPIILRMDTSATVVGAGSQLRIASIH